MNCKAPRCDVALPPGTRLPLCVSCRYVARWAFAFGAFVAGVVVGIVRLINK